MDQNYNFELITEFSHYISSRDKTNVTPAALVKNSKNMYKKISGNIANRPGRKVYGALSNALNGIVANYDWVNTNFTKLMRVLSDGSVQFLYRMVWYTLLQTPGSTRYIFDSWYDGTQGQSALIMCNGTDSMTYWPGGIAMIASVGSTPTVTAITVQNTGTNYSIGDVFTIGGQGSDAFGQVTGVDGSNAVTTVVLLQGGKGYAVGNNIPTSTFGSGPTSKVGLTVNITSVAVVTTLTKDQLDGIPTWGQASFYNTTIPGNGEFYSSSLAALTINGVQYAYDGSGIDSDTIVLSGMFPAIMAGSIAFSTTFSNNFGATVDFLKVIGNQVYFGAYASTLILATSGNDWTDITPVANGGLGTPFQVVLDGLPTAIALQKSSPVIFSGRNRQTVLTISQVSVNQGTNFPSILVQNVFPARSQTRYDTNPISQEFIDGDGNYIVWLGLDNQLHVFGATNSLFLSDKNPSLSQAIQTELKNVNFSGGALRWIGEFIYITAPLIATHYVYQERESVDEGGTVRTERIWNPPQITGISRFSDLNGVIYGHSNLNPMMYQIWDTGQWHDDAPDENNNLIALPYECVMAMAYLQLPGKTKSVLRANKLNFDKIYVEGYIAPGTPLLGTVYFDYQGATDTQTIYINNPAIPGIAAQPALVKNTVLYSYLTAPPLGADSLADNPIGEGITFSTDAQDYLPKFRAIRKVTPKPCFEVGTELYSYALDARWEILAMGLNIQSSAQVPSGLL